MHRTGLLELLDELVIEILGCLDFRDLLRLGCSGLRLDGAYLISYVEGFVWGVHDVSILAA